MDLAAAILKKREKELNKPKKSVVKKVVKKPKKATIADFKGSVAKANKPVFKSVSKLKPTPTSIVAKVPSAPKKVAKKVTSKDFAGVKSKSYKGTLNKRIHNGTKIAGYGIGAANTLPVYENDDFLTQLGKQAVNTIVGVPKTALGVIGLAGEGLRQLPIQSTNLIEGKGFKEYKGPTTARDMLGEDWGKELEKLRKNNPLLADIAGGIIDVTLDPMNFVGIGGASMAAKGAMTTKKFTQEAQMAQKIVSKQAQKQAKTIANGIITKSKSGLKLTEKEKNIVKNNPKTFAEINVSKVDQDAQKVYRASQDVKKPHTPAQEAFLKNRELNRASLESTAPKTTSKSNNTITLYRGLEKEFDPKFDLSKTDAPNGYSTWTNNPELARQYAGKNGFIYKIELPKSKLGKELIDNDGERVLFLNNKKNAALNNVSGDEYLIYNYHDDYSPGLISKLNTTPKVKIKGAKTIKGLNESTTAGLNVSTLKDVGSLERYAKNIQRLVTKVEGKGQQGKIKKILLDPLDAGKKASVEMQKKITDELYTNIVKKLGIKKGSKESAAVQWFGEGKKIQGTEKVLDAQTGQMVKNAKLVDYTLSDLKKDFPDKWEDIVKADKFFRKIYDDTIVQMNNSRKLIYGNVKAKIQKVEDQINSLTQTLDEKTLQELDLKRGRTFKTVKEIDLDNQVKNIESKIAKNKLLLEKLKNKKTVARKSKKTIKEIPIGDRKWEDVSSPKVKSYQSKHPELRDEIQTEARFIKAELLGGVKGERYPILDEHGYIITWSGTKKLAGPTVQKIQNVTKASYKKIEDALDAIIKGDGSENTALAKKIEMIIDDNLTYGVERFDGSGIPEPPNQLYIDKKMVIQLAENKGKATTPIIQAKIKSLQEQLLLKRRELEKANTFRQPTQKKIEDIARQKAKIKALIEAKKDLIESGELWRGKIIPKRDNYYRHFREISDNFEALKNVFDTPAQIDPSLAGTSDFTQPFSKFLSLAQRRGKGFYKADAVGGLLDYTRAASYATHIDPHIIKFRKFAADLAKETAESRHLNNTIEYLRDYSNSLAGKTGVADRVAQKFAGRKVMNILNWGNKRVKANTVVGNATSSLSQIVNIPQGIATVKNPIWLTRGAGNTLKGFVTKNAAMAKSGFINERYSDRLFRRFDTRWIDQPKRFASWMLEAGDEIGTKFIWNSVYEKALAKGIKDPIKYADDITRNLVAGRGVGEVPLMQQEKVFQMVAPFQLEVANLWHVMKDFVKAKDFGGLATLFIANYMFNRGMEKVRGSGVVFDPIRAIEQSLSDDDTNLFEKLGNFITKGETPHIADTSLLQKGGRLAGEVLSNVPLGQTLASWYPEYGSEIPVIGAAIGTKLPTRKDLFGREDPTRYGTGSILTKAILKPEYALLPPFGGIQIEKTQKGIEALLNKGVEKDGKLKYPVKQDASNIIKGTLFGTGGLSETKDYYNNDRRPFTEKQTAEFKALVAKGFNPDKLYNYMMLERKLKSLETKYNKAKTKDEVQKIIEEYKRVSGQFAILGQNLK